jgi:hypothetical protein
VTVRYPSLEDYPHYQHWPQLLSDLASQLDQSTSGKAS